MTAKRPLTPPILSAVLARDPVALLTLLESGVGTEHRDRDGRTALMQACAQDDEELVAMLLTRGSDPAAFDGAGWTALHFAAQNYNVRMVQRLLASSAPVDAIDEHGNTPLFRAVFSSKGRGDVIQALLAAGADRNRKNSHGVSPKALAATIANYNVAQWLQSTDPDRG